MPADQEECFHLCVITSESSACEQRQVSRSQAICAISLQHCCIYSGFERNSPDNRQYHLVQRASHCQFIIVNCSASFCFELHAQVLFTLFKHTAILSTNYLHSRRPRHSTRNSPVPYPKLKHSRLRRFSFIYDLSLLKTWALHTASHLRMNFTGVKWCARKSYKTSIHKLKSIAYDIKWTSIPADSNLIPIF